MALARTLRLGDAVAVGLGSMVGAGVFAVWAPAASAAGRWLLVSLALAAAVAVCNALSSAALAVRHPSAGGTYVYGRERLGDLAGYLAGWSFVVGKTASCAAMAMTAAAYAVPGHERPAAVVAVVLVSALNLSGVQRSARASRWIVGVVLTVLTGVVLASLASLAGDTGGQAWSAVAPSGDVDVPAVLQAAGLLFFAFAGYARIATLAEEVVEPERTIPRAVAVTVTTVLVVYLVLAVTLLLALGPERLATEPAPVALLAHASWGAAGAAVVGGAAALAALGALLNLLLGISRTTLAMARGGHLPVVLGRVGGSHRIPWVAELVVAAAVLALVLTLDLRGAIGFSSFGVLLYYAVANAAAWTVRDDRAGGRIIPVLGLTGCLGLALALPTGAVVGGLVVLGLGLCWYAVRPGR